MERVRSEWVIHYELNTDIHVLAGDLDLQLLEPRMPNCCERFLGSTFFNRRSRRFAEQGQEVLAIWHFRAALAHFQGILDLVTTDIPAQYNEIWNRSEIKESLYSHELVYTMTRVRNLALHANKLEFPMQDRTITMLPSEVSTTITRLVFDSITLELFEPKDRKRIGPNVISWFNRQASFWSANELLTEACYILMKALDTFAGMNAKYMVQNDHAIDRVRLAHASLSSE
jgi:hypothetical protein